MRTLAIKKWNWIGFALALVVLISGCSGGGPSSSGNIGVPNAQDVLYVANENAQTLMAIDLSSGFDRVSGTGLSSGANDMKIRPGSNELWVLHTFTPEMRRYTIQTDKTQAPVFINSYSLDIFQGSTSPEMFDFSNSGTDFYVTSWNYGCVSLRESATGNDRQDLQVGPRPEGVTVLPNGNVAVAITSYNGTDGLGNLSYGFGEVVLCDSALSGVIVRDTVGINPRVIRYYNNALYIVCSGDFGNTHGTLWKLDPTTLTSTALPIVLNGAYPGDMAIDVDSTGTAWGVLCAVSNDPNGAQALFIVNLTSWQPTQAISMTGNPFRVVTLPHGGTATALKTSNEILVRLRDGTTYYLQAGDGPLAIAAIAK